MSEQHESLPLLQQDGSERGLHRPCSVSRRKIDSLGDLSLATQDDESTCYLQHGGESASGKRVTRKLVLATGLAFTFMILEVVGGYFAGSIAIMSDAAHMFSDVFSLVVSVYCMHLIERKSDAVYSFGYHRAETIGALVSIIIVCVLTGGLVLEAIQRFMNPEPVNGKLMFIVSVLGIFFNLLLLATLGHDHHVHLGGGTCGHDHGAHASHDHSHGHSHDHSHDHANETSRAQDHGSGCREHGSHAGCGHGHNRESTSQSSHAHKTGSRGELQAVHAHSDHAHESNEAVTPQHSACYGHNDHEHHAHGAAGGPSPCGHNHGNDHDHGSHSHAVRSHNHGCNGHDHSHDAHGHDHDNQNLRGAIVHVLGDLLQSVGVAAAGAVIWYTDGDRKWLWVDPMCTFIFAISVIWVTKTLIVDITKDLMEAVPSNINTALLIEKMKGVSGVDGVHDMHVWRIGTGKVMMTAHVDVASDCNTTQVHSDLEDLLAAAGIAHSTVQLCCSAEKAR